METAASIAHSESAQEVKTHKDLFLAGSAEDLHNADSAAGTAPALHPQSTISPVGGVSRRLDLIGSAVIAEVAPHVVTCTTGQHPQAFTSKVEVLCEVPSKVPKDVTWPCLAGFQKYWERLSGDSWGKTVHFDVNGS